MKKCNLKNIIWRYVFCILVIFFGGFNANAEGPKLEDILVHTQREVYCSLSLRAQREIENFYFNLEKIIWQNKKYHRGYKKEDFVEFLRRIDYFLNSETDQQVKVKKAYIIGIANLEDGSYIVNTRHLIVFTSRCKSSLNLVWSEIGFYRPYRINIELAKIQSFFGNLLKGHCQLARSWSIREKLQQEPLHMPEILSPTPVPQKSSSDFLSTTSIEAPLTVPSDVRQDIDFSFDFEQNPDSLFGDSYNIDNFDFFD